ncbi:hypothetical protein A9Z39_13270 [Paenibacillus polymyxa]|nr:hypothetical protein A9Z39_13270 [Paenibacillus polymyxa]
MLSDYKISIIVLGDFVNAICMFILKASANIICKQVFVVQGKKRAVRVLFLLPFSVFDLVHFNYS